MAKATRSTRSGSTSARKPASAPRRQRTARDPAGEDSAAQATATAQEAARQAIAAAHEQALQAVAAAHAAADQAMAAAEAAVARAVAAASPPEPGQD